MTPEELDRVFAAAKRQRPDLNHEQTILRSVPNHAKRRLFFKITDAEGKPTQRFDFRWPLPRKTATGWRPGRWVAAGLPDEPIEPCVNGLHVVEWPYIDSYIGPGKTVWLCEVRGEVVGDGSKWMPSTTEHNTKFAVREARLLRPVISIDAALWNTVEAERVKRRRGPYIKRIDALLDLLVKEAPVESGLIFGLHTIDHPWPTLRWRKRKMTKKEAEVFARSKFPPPGWTYAP